MRAVIQKVKKASVESDGVIVGKINSGLLILLAIKKEDTEDAIWKMAKKIVNLRIFSDKNDKMNKSILDVNGEILVVSQFTLYGDVKKGNRPGFIESEKPERALLFYERFVEILKGVNILVKEPELKVEGSESEIKSQGLRVETGAFQKYMEVSLVNDGPTTIIIDI